MNECMQQFLQAVQSGQLDPNMTVGALAQQMQGGQGGAGAPAPEAPMAPEGPGLGGPVMPQG